MTISRKNNRRRVTTLLLNPRYQLKFVLLVMGSSLCLAAANAGVFYHYVSENYSILVDLSPMTDEAKQQLYRELHQIVISMTMISIGFSGLAGIVALWLSHRTAGPLYRFRRVFEQIAEGQRDLRVNLRPGDEFQEVADAFNVMMDRLGHTKNVPLPDSTGTPDRKKGQAA